VPICGGRTGTSCVGATGGLPPPSGGWTAGATNAGFMRGLLAHSSFECCIHNAAIGQHEIHLLAIAPEEQIGIHDDPMLIRRGEGPGTVRVDRIGPGIGDVVRDHTVLAEGVDAAHRAVAVILILASKGDIDRLPSPQMDPTTVIRLGSFERAQRAGVVAQCLLRLPSSTDEEPYDQDHPNTNLSLHGNFLLIGKRVSTYRARSPHRAS